MSQTFIVILRPGAAWLAGKPITEQPLQEHGQYVLQLHLAGKLRFAGPFADDSGGAAVFEAADEAEARRIVDNDPAVINQIFVYDLHPWRLLPWEQYAKAATNSNQYREQ